MNIDGSGTPGDGSRSLLEHLRSVTDPRKARGIRHPLESILVVIAVAKLCGANSVGQPVRHDDAAAGAGPLRTAQKRQHRPLPRPQPDKRAIRVIDAYQADAAVCAWLRQEAAASRVKLRHLTVDGKPVNGVKNAAGRAPHLLAAYDLTDGSVAAQLDVDAKHNEITYFADLLACLDTTEDSGGNADASAPSPPEGSGLTWLRCSWIPARRAAWVRVSSVRSASVMRRLRPRRAGHRARRCRRH